MIAPTYPAPCQQAIADWRAGTGPQVVGCAQGVNQFWPVYASPPKRDQRHVGGTCPPHAPLRYVPAGRESGWRCVEEGSLGEGDGMPPASPLLIVGLAAMMWWLFS